MSVISVNTVWNLQWQKLLGSQEWLLALAGSSACWGTRQGDGSQHRSRKGGRTLDQLKVRGSGPCEICGIRKCRYVSSTSPGP